MGGISFTLQRIEGGQKQQTAAPNGFSLFVMRLLLLPACGEKNEEACWGSRG